MKKIFTILTIVLFTLQLNAQNKELYKDKVSLVNGSILYGQILNYKIGDKVELKLLNGSILNFEDTFVKKIEIYSPGSNKEKKEYNFKSNTIYSYFGFKIMPGNYENLNVPKSGIGIDYSLGYRTNEYVSIGVGVSVETYNYGFGEFLIPIYLDYISFLKKKNISPFLRLQAGYGFVYSTGDNVIDSNGGLMVNPAIGIRFTGNSDVNYSFDLNFKYQKANFVVNTTNWRSQISYIDIIFRRLSFRFGVLF